MSLLKCAKDMAAHTAGWNLTECYVGSPEPWLKDCLGANFEVCKYLLESDLPANNRHGENSYRMSLAQRCEYAWYEKLLTSLSDRDRLRLMSNSGPTQTWVTALPLSWKNWNLTSREWLIAARRPLGLDVRTKKTRCSNYRYHEIGLKGDHALICSGKMGSKMRREVLKVLLARAFKQIGFEIKLEQSGGLLDKRRPGDVAVENWVVIGNWREDTSLLVDVAIIDPTGDSHSALLRRDGAGA